jgi:hypothetical protein
MWIFTKDGFYSVVEDRNDPSVFLVRARIEGDIERLWPTAKVERNTGTDYAYRARIHRTVVSKVLAETVEEIDYDNFKSAVTDDRRGGFYAQIWNIAWDMQRALGA